MQNNQTIINFLLGLLLFVLGGFFWLVRKIITDNDKCHDELKGRITAVESAAEKTSEQLARLETEHKIYFSRRKK